MKTYSEKIMRWLDEIELSYANAPDEQAIRLGLTMCFYYRYGGSYEKKLKVVECFDRFYAEYGCFLKKNYYSDFINLTDKNYAKTRQEFIDLPNGGQYEWLLTSTTEDYISEEYSIFTLIPRAFSEEFDRSILVVNLPWHFISSDAGLERFKTLFYWLCQRLDVDNGYAGLSPILPYDDDFLLFPNEYQLAKKFSGLIIDTVDKAGGGREYADEIKGANWIVALSPRYVKRLGGEPWIRNYFKLDSEITVTKVGDTLVMQAGEYPELGEVNTDGLPANYIRLNSLLRPIRIKKPDQLHYYSEYKDLQFEKESTER
uniref:type VI immunity family protein n=1 Tax=Serratia sp. (in: enterobacteria) TaxID=616 RepID=UPI00398A147E